MISNEGFTPQKQRIGLLTMEITLLKRIDSVTISKNYNTLKIVSCFYAFYVAIFSIRLCRFRVVLLH